MPRPSGLHRPPKAETGEGEVTPQDIRRQDESSSTQRYPTPRQQLNVQVNPQQVQAGGLAQMATPAQATAIPAGSPTVTPPQANVLRRAQVGRPARGC